MITLVERVPEQSLSDIRVSFPTLVPLGDGLRMLVGGWVDGITRMTSAILVSEAGAFECGIPVAIERWAPMFRSALVAGRSPGGLSELWMVDAVGSAVLVELAITEHAVLIGGAGAAYVVDVGRGGCGLSCYEVAPGGAVQDIQPPPFLPLDGLALSAPDVDGGELRAVVGRAHPTAGTASLWNRDGRLQWSEHAFASGPLHRRSYCEGRGSVYQNRWVDGDWECELFRFSGGEASAWQRCGRLPVYGISPFVREDWLWMVGTGLEGGCRSLALVSCADAREVEWVPLPWPWVQVVGPLGHDSILAVGDGRFGVLSVRRR